NAWCSDGVFPVVPALVRRQQPLPIAKNHPILVIRKRAALVNQGIGLAPLERQLCHGNRGSTIGQWLVARLSYQRSQRPCSTQNTRKPCIAYTGGYSLQHL